ncbi:MAG: hypothetical protein ACJA13_003955 [Paraglaciecola sp.]|jgi:hypothetical protein
MKRFCISIILLLTVLSISSNSYIDVPIPDGPYLGQKPPGSMPEIFAPGILNTKDNREIEGMFAEDMKVTVHQGCIDKFKSSYLELFFAQPTTFNPSYRVKS